MGKTVDVLESFLSKSNSKGMNAKALLDHLVLGGYVAPVEEGHDRVTQSEHFADLENHASILSLKRDSVSVWSVRHGAIQAGT
uniref:AlNc14C74G5018 protein n=1 Tax=Albugo laibachii Nc14 TaxID=890382 RepID=F0WEG4_9STRA|nr:AlNc14C74G5018 [Albugo laibachii Nc14]|eukprot:CCA19596.1 AlNc14C74G5018 [Albugo laibachii Nc14]